MPLLCFGTPGAAAAVSAAYRERRDHRRVLPQRVGIRIRRARRAQSRDAAARRLLGAQRREDVDDERRLRRRVHRVCEGRRRALLARSSSSARFPGVTSGKEEHKMGLHGSSTTPLVLSDARVPAENLLGEVGRGHKIAFNVLNYGRFKLAGMCTGSAKLVVAEAAAYAASASTVRPADRVLRRDSSQARGDDVATVRDRKHAVPDGRPHRRGDRRRRTTTDGDRARGARGIRHRVVDAQGRRQRDDRVRRRRERADSRRQRLRARLSGRAALSGRARRTASSRARTRSTACSCRRC